MNRIILFSLVILSFTAYSQVDELQSRVEYKQKNFKLADYLTNNPFLQAKVDSIYAKMEDSERVAQLLMPAIGKYGQSEEVIYSLVKAKKIGGVLLLNGTKDQMSTWVETMNNLTKTAKGLPFLYSADAEPSLVNRKITGSTQVKKANEIATVDEVVSVAKTISDDLKEIGINYNFAPVLDMSTNATVGYRGFGANPANIIPWSNAFIAETQRNGIIATAKHFPGHGLVSGDTHKSLQIIDGELLEVPNYPSPIAEGVLSVMIGHLAVKNNTHYSTDGMPATLSSKIVQDLLRDSLNFKGLIVTDAMNMGGVAKVPNANVLAIEAGCDIVLMPLDAEKAHQEILALYLKDEVFKKKVELAAKRVIRSKICLGLMR